MPDFSVTSYRLERALSPFDGKMFAAIGESTLGGAFDALKKNPLPPHSSHPDFGHLVLLVFEAVLEVVCVSLPGYIVARQGMFDAESQKFLANLNVQLFTPCLIFTKLASQLTAEKLVELAVIPLIFVMQTLVSYLCSLGMSKLFRFSKRAQNFVTAMGVFGNSNSLPISLVISLSKTLDGLHWDKIPGDNDDEVAARGILYLLIFQQLGQLVRWSWGYHVLLAPPEKYEDEDDNRVASIEDGTYDDESESPEESRLLADDSLKPSPNGQSSSGARATSEYTSGTATPMNRNQYADSESDSRSVCSCSTDYSHGDIRHNHAVLPDSTNGNVNDGHTYANGFKKAQSEPTTWPGRLKRRLSTTSQKTSATLSAYYDKIYSVLPKPMQTVVSFVVKWGGKFFKGLWEFMNPPLWAMLVAIVVASVPKLQHLFFDHGTFINNSVTRAVAQSGGVAVPLILVVLGANLARNTLPREQLGTDDPILERNLLIASIISRMLLPTIIMAPILALMAKYVPVSILDDPIFVIVCFLLTGAPSALQLAQICQINNVYMGAISRLLFQSYVIWFVYTSPPFRYQANPPIRILPSTLVLVMMALEVVEWAGR